MTQLLLSLRGLIPVLTPVLTAIDNGGEAATRQGVVLQPADDVLARQTELQSASAIAVEFPKFTDGRGYSIASVLRQRLGYNGPLRAIGDVLVDQLAMMARVGFDEFELRADQDEQLALRALRSFSLRYQQAAGDANFANAGNLILPVKYAVVADQHTKRATDTVAV